MQEITMYQSWLLYFGTNMSSLLSQSLLMKNVFESNQGKKIAYALSGDGVKGMMKGSENDNQHGT